MRFWGILLLSQVLYSGEGEEEALFLRRIAEFWQEGEHQIAKSQMEEFIAAYPESSYSEALCAALGDLFLREKNFSSALNYYTRIQTPEFSDQIFLNRMQCLCEMEWYATLADECEAYLEKGPNLHVTYFLAIGLYHQCLNASKEAEQLLKLAERARPYFEILSQSELSGEIAQGYAHLCCIFKDFPKASQIYLELANKDPTTQEEMLFQGALIQAEYDKELAMRTFDQIAKLGQKRAKEAAYNRWVLSFDLGHYEDWTQENLFSEIPLERVGMAHLFLGRSLFNLQKYDAAIREFKTYVQDAPVSETLHMALLSLLDASYQCNDLASLDQAIAKLASLYPQDPDLPKAYFSRAQILKKNQNLPEAKKEFEQLLVQFPQFQQQAQAIFELIQLDYKVNAWDACYKRACTFLTQFPDHELSPFAWRYFISSSAEMALEKPELRKQLLVDLETFLKLPLADSEKAEWTVLLAKTHYELQDYEPAILFVQNLKEPNARLLLALCYRDGHRDLARFCEIAEAALSEGANLIAPGQIHAALFNAYLELSQIEQGAEHLYAAFQANVEIKTENLLWLADVYLSRLQEEEDNFALAHRTALLLDKCKAALHDSEPFLCKLAKVYSLLGRTDEEIALLQALPSPSPEAQLLLAESYARKGVVEKAVQMFDAIVSSSATLRTPVSASASLQGARLKLAGGNPDLAQIAIQLKSLVVQKNFEGEPFYLEAALDYVDIQSKADLAKRVALLQKTKADFERRDDLLSKDYHEARAKWPRKEKTYLGYLQLIEAEICAAQATLDTQNQKDLKAKSKELLLQIVNEQTATALVGRARMLLASVDELKAKT